MSDLMMMDCTSPSQTREGIWDATLWWDMKPCWLEGCNSNDAFWWWRWFTEGRRVKNMMRRSASFLIYYAWRIKKSFSRDLFLFERTASVRSEHTHHHTVCILCHWCLWKTWVCAFCCFKLLGELHLENWGESWTLSLAKSTMTLFLLLYSWLALCMNLATLQRETGTEERRDIACARVCGYGCMCTCHRCVWPCVSVACMLQFHVMCIWIWSGCSLPASFLHPLCFSQQNQCVPEGEAGKTCGGEPGGAGGRPSLQYLLLAADWSQLVQGRLPKYYALSICFGLVCVFR